MEVGGIEPPSEKVNRLHLQVQLCEVIVDCRQQHNKRRQPILIKSPDIIPDTNVSKSRQVKENHSTRNRAECFPAQVLTQQVLLLRSKRQLLLLFLRKLQLFFCQFKEPSLLLAVKDFSIPSKPVHPLILFTVVIYIMKFLLIFF